MDPVRLCDSALVLRSISRCPHAIVFLRSCLELLEEVRSLEITAIWRLD